MVSGDGAADCRTVLLVEDDPDVRESLAMLLKLHGVRVVTAADGAEALDWMRRVGPPGLVLLDLMMPVMNGWQLRAAMLGDPSLARVPVVILSGADDVEGAAAALGAAAYLRKPLDFSQVRRLVDAHCARA